MNDPHVEALHYTVRHSDNINYDKACPLTHHAPGFVVRIENGRAEITMKTHHATVETARDEVEPFLRMWELMAALQLGPGEIEFAYDQAKVIDRNSIPGAPSGVNVKLVQRPKLSFTMHRQPSKYPDPPTKTLARDAVVELMFDRFRRYWRGDTSLADAAYFCLTVLEGTAGGRKNAATHFAVSKPILTKLGELAASKGGNEARKASGAKAEFTVAERQWLDKSIRRLILRAAEIAGNPSASFPHITMTDLPPLSGPS